MELAMELELRFRSKIEIHPETGCWFWLGSIDRYGYGRVKMFGKNRQAHAAIYELLVEPVPLGMTLDHLKGDRGPCRFRHCVCPEHLEVVSRSENARRVHIDKAAAKLAAA